MKRKDGVRLKGTDPMYTLGAHFMNHRYDAMNMTTIDLPIEPISKYVNIKRKTDNPTNHLALILAAYVRTMANFPELNRFIVNKRFYGRDYVDVGMVVLKKGSMDHGTMNKVRFEMGDNLDTVTKKINDYIAQNKTEEEGTNATDKFISILMKIPGIFSIGLPLIKWADRHGMLPQSIIDASPFHACVLVTNLASIKTRHVYHHVYEFGTTSISLALGKYRTVTSTNSKGEISYTKCLPIGVVMDERIASGGYCALAFKEFMTYCTDPSKLENTLTEDEIIRDPNMPVKKKKK